MKVLFALNNDNVSNAIIKKYQKQYKEIISYKNVYYFNAILKELQKDKTYNRVVISADLEPFANNDYDTIDKFIFEKLDKISDEATNQNGDDIEIILICSDRTNKSDSVLVKFFGIGIYNAIIGNDRQIDTVCKLINQPRTKKEAKQYYKIESNSVNYQSESENSVNETEVQNILAHYKRLGKNEDKYVDSFNTIVAQYTDEQLKIIIKFLPLNVKAVLEERSPKYQELATFSTSDNKGIVYNNYAKKSKKKKEAIAVKMLNEESSKSKITRPIVIPSALKNKAIKKVEEENAEQRTTIKPTAQDELSEQQPINDEQEFNENMDEKRGRGRPKKKVELDIEQTPKRGRGRPKKESVQTTEPEDEELIDAFNLSKEIEVPDIKIEDKIEIPDVIIEEQIHENEISENDEEEINLFELGEEEEEESNKHIEEQDDVIDLFNIDEDSEENIPDEVENHMLDNNTNKQKETTINEIVSTTNSQTTYSTSSLITKDTKVVCFVGTTKNGTSFLVNNVAEMLATMNIPTAILDMTKTRNAYYIYTKNEENLRNIAIQSIKKLEQGIASRIEVNKKLSVYTALPDDDFEIHNIDMIISTLAKEHSVVLIDCDFTTPVGFFENAQEIYLVQTQDVLTIQPLTAFLRNLKAKNVLKQEKLKIVINKEQNIKGLSDKVLIGGMAYYNDPAMSFMTELFNKDNIMYCKIPFEMQNYAKYLASLVNCSITLNGYTKQFMKALNELVEMVYPLINRPNYSPRGNKNKNKQPIFSNEVNNTLNKMKNNY